MRESTVITGWIAEGEAKGQRKALHAALQRVLQARFRAPIPDDLTAAIQAVNDSETLDRWLEIAAVVDSLDAFRAAVQR